MAEFRMKRGALNTSVDDVVDLIRNGTFGSTDEIAEALDSLSVAGILRGLVEDVGADEVLLLGKMEGHWKPSSAAEFTPITIGGGFPIIEEGHRGPTPDPRGLTLDAGSPLEAEILELYCLQHVYEKGKLSTGDFLSAAKKSGWLPDNWEVNDKSVTYS